MACSGKNTTTSESAQTVNRADVEAIVESAPERQSGYLEAHLNQFEENSKCTEGGYVLFKQT